LQAKALIILGSILILFALGCSYYTFFVPKVGPIGEGKFASTTYIVLICAIINGILAIIRGILILKREKA